MRIHTIRIVFTLALMLFGAPWLVPAVRGHDSMYVGGTVAGLDKSAKGKLDPQIESLSFNPDKGTELSIPYIQITAMEYGEHAGRRVAAAILVAWPLLFSHKKKHFLTIYFNTNPGKAAAERELLAKDPKASAAGDVAAFEVNKRDFSEIMATLQAKTGLKVTVEEVSH